MFICGSILIICLSYSLGIERGRRHLKQKPDNARSADLLLDEASITNEIHNTVSLDIDTEEMVQEDPEKIVPPVLSKPPHAYTVQVVTYRTPSRAKKEMDVLQNKGYEPFLIPSGEYYQVCVGKYQTRKDATMMLAVLKKRYDDAFIRNK